MQAAAGEIGAQLRRTFHGHTNNVVSLAFRPDGKVLASASIDGTIKLWPLSASRKALTLEGHTDCVESLAYTGDGRFLVSGSKDKTVRLWDAATGKETIVLVGHLREVYCVACSPNGKVIASGGMGTILKLWDVQTGKCTHSLEGHTCAVDCLAFSPSGSLLASASGEEIVLWDAARGKKIATVNSGDSDTATLADITRGKTRPSYGACCLAFSPDGKTLAAGDMDNNVKLWNTVTCKVTMTLHGHTGTVYSVAFSPNEKTLASGSEDHTVKLWDVATGKNPATLDGHAHAVLSVDVQSRRQDIGLRQHGQNGKTVEHSGKGVETGTQLVS